MYEIPSPLFFAREQPRDLLPRRMVNVDGLSMWVGGDLRSGLAVRAPSRMSS